MASLFTETIISYAQSVLPWLVIGSLVAYIVERRFPEEKVRAYLGAPSVRKLIFIQALGMISPLSIMSQLPVAGSLVRLGANPGLLLSFFIAERAYDLQSFPIIAGLFGLKFAALNALAIFLALTFAAFLTRKFSVTMKKEASADGGSFWLRQGKIIAVVIFGIIVGAGLRTFVPEDIFSKVAGTPFGSMVAALAIGFILYFGTVLGNYPVGKALADLGMHQTGVFTFMTVSPIFSLVVIFLFAAAVPLRHVVRQFVLYACAATALTLFLSLWL